MRGMRPLSRAAALFVVLAAAAPASAATLTRSFQFSPDEFTLQRAEQGRVRVAARGAVGWGEVGGPELPAYSVLVDLPAGERAVSLAVRAVDWAPLGAGHALAPVQPDRRAGETGPLVEAAPALYAGDEWTREAVAELALSGRMRERPLAAVRLFPVQYRPATGELRVTTRIEVSLETELDPTPARRLRQEPAWEAEFAATFERSLENGPSVWRQGLDATAAARLATAPQSSPYGDRIGARPFAPTALPSVEGSPVRYLIVTNDALAPQFDSLAAWKTRKGVPAVVRTMEFIEANFPFGVDPAERLRLFLREAYEQWGTQYVLLGGDTKVIPERFGRTTFYNGNYIAADLYFSDLDGNWDSDGDSLFGEGFIDSTKLGDQVDLLPDVYVGRVPVENAYETSLWLAKLFGYERNMPAGYGHRALFCAEVMFPQDWQPGQSVALDGAFLAESAIDKLPGSMIPTRLYENRVPYDSLGADSLTAQAAIDSMNLGYNMVHHAGHGFRNSMSMGDAPITNPDVAGLTNAPQFAGLVYSINCTSAAIDFESIGEEFLIAPSGGAVNNIGSTHFDFPTTGGSYQNEFFTQFFTNDERCVGAAQALQKVPFVGFATFDNVHRWTQFTLVLLGDPEMPFVAGEPATLAVSHAASVSLADTAFSVHVEKDGLPLADATVCLYKPGEEYRILTTDGAGDAATPFRAATAGTFQLTVTALDVRPYETDVTVTAAAGVALSADGNAPTITDSGGSTNGNGNSVLDAGETVEITLPVTNVGGAGSGSVSGTLLSLDSRLTVDVAAASYGVIAPSGTAAGTSYRITVTEVGATDGDEVPARLVLTDGLGGTWSEDLSFTLRAPKLRSFGHVLADVGPGNGDSFPDIGETVDLTFTILNLTEGSARGVAATLEPVDAGINVLTGASTFGDLAGDAQVAGTAFRIENVSEPDPSLVLTVTDAYGVGFSQRIDFSLPASPTSPKGTGSASTIAVVWTKSNAPDLEGYNVYRSSASGGPYSKVNLLPTGRIAYYLDAGLAPLTRYYYKVASVDSSFNESAASAVISASTNPPALNGFPIPMGRTTPSSPAVADFNADGMLEAAVGSDFLYVFQADALGLVDADGSERTLGDFTDEGSYFASAPAFSDLDSDGVMDLVAIAWDSKQLFILQPDGSHKGASPIALLDNVWSSPAIGDIDGDGDKEIVFNSNGTRVYAFNHDGTEFSNGDNNAGTNGVFKVVGSSFNFGSPALADLDHDGRLDIIVPLNANSLQAWRYDGTSLPGFPYATGGNITSSPAVGDIDDDGLLEIVFVSTDNALHVVQENGVSQAGFPKFSISSGGNSRSPTPALIDLNADGQHEILLGCTDGKLRIVLHNGLFYPGWSAVTYSALTSKASESSPVAADLDGDGDLEILQGSEDGQLYGFDASAGAFAGFPIRLDGEVRGTPVVTDFDRDGDSEILVAGWDKNLYVWTYPGTRTPDPEREWTMFGHDPERTNRLDNPIVVGVERRIAEYDAQATDGGAVLSWTLPVGAIAEGGAWRAVRKTGHAEGLPAILSGVPDGYLPVGPEEVLADATGILRVEDSGLIPGQDYSYVLARVAAAPGLPPLAYGPYPFAATAAAPERLYLAGAAYPNPGRGDQVIAFGVPSGVAAGTRVRLDLYDVRGAHVRTLVHRAAEPGRFVATWDGRGDGGTRLAGGVYLYRLAVGAEVLRGRLVRLLP